MNTRTEWLQIRVRHAFKEQVRGAAEKAGVSMSEFVRLAIAFAIRTELRETAHTLASSDQATAGIRPKMVIEYGPGVKNSEPGEEE